MRTPLAWHNLTHNKVRSLVAVTGVAFAVVLMFMQLGFLGSVETTVTRIYEAMDFDLMLRSRGYLHLCDPKTFPQSRLYRAASDPDVRAVAPLHMELNTWRNPIDGRHRSILTMGINPEDRVFALPEIERKSKLLSDRQFVLIDRRSRHEFGPRQGKQFSDADVGQVAEVGGRQVKIVGHFALGTGLAADGAILLNSDAFVRLLPGRTPEEVSLGLVRLSEGVDPVSAAARLTAIMPPDVDVLTREEVIGRELDRWVKETSIGTIFQLGVVVVLVVGTAIVYQVLSSDVASHMAEYATLKALGYSSRRLSSVVLQQALMLSLFGFLPGLALAEGLYRLTTQVSGVPIANNPQRIAFVLALTVVMCTISGLGALSKVVSADPADLF